jgi:ketosteroid isomerase-like protein
MKRNILIFIFLILVATSFKYRSKTQAGILNPDSRVIIEQVTNDRNNPGLPAETETDEIRTLENHEREASIAGDTAALFSLWAEELIVTNPDNSIRSLADLKRDMAGDAAAMTPFDRMIEKITITGQIAVVMGSEVSAPDKGEKTKEAFTRRYTNIWMKKGGEWKLTARQATNVPAKK